MQRAAAIVLLLLPLAGDGVATEPADPAGAIGQVAPTATRFRDFLDAASPFMVPEERAAFLALTRDYQRDAFVERFWRVHDPFPETPRNELRERVEERLGAARDRFGSLEDDRARMLLVFGEPSRVSRRICAELNRPLEIWWYASGGGVGRAFDLVFFPAAREEGATRFALWAPSSGLFSLLSPELSGGSTEGVLSRLDESCPGPDSLAEALSQALDWPSARASSNLVRQADAEWLSSFSARTTDLPPGAETLAATLGFDFPARVQSRTVVDGWLKVPGAAATVGELGPYRGYSFLLEGEVLQDDDLFERFRYRFDLPADASAAPAGDALPLFFQRRLRPGTYRLVLRLEDLHGHRFYRAEQTLEVPTVTAATATSREASAPSQARTASGGRTPEPPAGFAEARADLPTGDQDLMLRIPSDRLLTGKLRIEARTIGEGIARVVFALDGREVMTKARPPYSVELNLGDAPRLHWVSAVAYSAEGSELARDEAPVNGGPHRFAVRLREPRAGRTYHESLRAEALVEVPEGEELDRVEFYLNETLLATLYQAPFVQPLRLPALDSLTYVRVVARLESGLTDEDVVVVNAPVGLESVDVDLVELFVTALDRRGRPLDDLAEQELTVLEGGAVQKLRRFERVSDLPFHAAVVLDTSGSMAEELDQAERAAYRFFTQVLTPRDRAAVIPFADKPRLAARFTANLEVLAGALAGLAPEGETALWDTLAFSLHYFSGVGGRRALVVLTDGADSSSKHKFEDVLEYARRTGVSLYFVGLNLPSRPVDIQVRLEQLARETGGHLYLIRGVNELDPVYRQIRDELRSQYLLAYQSPAAGGSARFRPVEVRTSRPGVQVKAPAGYYPR